MASPNSDLAGIPSTPVDTTVPASRAQPQSGSAGRMVAVWTRQELRLLLREPVAVFFSLAFPAVIYVFIGMPYADESVADGVRFIDVMFPSLVGTVAANLLLMGLPIYIAELRGKEVVKRYRAMPLPGWVFGLAVVASMLALVACAAAVIIGMVAVGNGLRDGWASPSFLGLNLALVAMLCPIGFFLGTLPLSSRTIQALTSAVFFILFFGSGAAAPLDALPQAVKSILEWNPLKIWFDQLTNVYIGQGVSGEAGLKMLLTLAISGVALWAGLANWKRVS